MAFTKNIKKVISTPEQKLSILYIGAKGVLACSAFIFFGVYFFIASGFYAKIFIDFFIPFYLVFLLSYISFLCIATHYFGNIKKIAPSFLWIICAVWIGLGLIFLYPII